MSEAHQVELVREQAPPLLPYRSLEVLMEWDQPCLGRVGVDSFSLSCDWHWEGGWTVRTGSRLSGSQEWTRHSYEALSEDEALELVQMVVAEALGLV